MEKIASTLIHDTYYKVGDKFVWAYFNENLNAEEFYTLVVYGRTENQDKGFSISENSLLEIEKHFEDKSVLNLKEDNQTLRVAYIKEGCIIECKEESLKSPLSFYFDRTQISDMLDIYKDSKKQVIQNKESLERLRQVRVELGLQQY